MYGRQLWPVCVKRVCRLGWPAVSVATSPRQPPHSSYVQSRTRNMTTLRSSAADRNKSFILDVLRDVVANEKMTALEIASGTGQHVTYFAENLKHVSWQPSECDTASLFSIRSYVAESSLKNVQPPVTIDTTTRVEEWAEGAFPAASCDLVLCINMIHISEWAATQGLFRGSGYYLKPKGTLLTYGPYKVHDVISPESNVQFDQMLRQQNRSWGLRDTDELEVLAKENQMTLVKTVNMPANNMMLVFRKAADM